MSVQLMHELLNQSSYNDSRFKCNFYERSMSQVMMDSVERNPQVFPQIRNARTHAQQTFDTAQV